MFKIDFVKWKKTLKSFVPQFILNRYKRSQKKLLTNVFHTEYSKKCLLVYITTPFLYKINNSHQNQWQTYRLAQIISSYGYNVDVMDYDCEAKTFPQNYDMLIDIYPVDNRPFEEYLSPQCIRIAYLTGSDHEFSVREEKKRLNKLFVRRGVQLPVIRQAADLSLKLNEFNAIFFIGNEYNFMTYKKRGISNVSYIMNTGYTDLRVDYRKRKKTNFLFFASSGQVHKGLDLLLEVFPSLCQDCDLYICSSFKDEADFCRLYHKELYETKNIHPVGFINLEGEQAYEIFSKCTYVIVPSCSEARMGSALTCMSVGMIPVLTRECGYDEGEFIPIENIELNALAKLIHDCAARDSKWIEKKSRDMIRIVRSKYTKDAYIQSVRVALEKVLQV